MINKDNSIIRLINLVNNVFGNEAPTIEDHWKMDLCAIGLKKDNKLIYVSTTGCQEKHYFYECETLLTDSEMPYISGDSDDNVSEEQLLKVMSKFLCIQRKI